MHLPELLQANGMPFKHFIDSTLMISERRRSLESDWLINTVYLAVTFVSDKTSPEATVAMRKNLLLSQ